MDLRLQAHTADGRTLDTFVAGPEDGVAVLFHNGTPSSGQLYRPFVEAAAERGLRMVSFSRAGYGASTRQPGRTVADAAHDAETVLDRLGVDRFYTLGWSGGGPHALACAAFLPGRVIGAVTVGGLAPYGSEGLDWMAGMGDENVAAFRAALAGGVDLRAFLEQVVPSFATMTGDQVVARLGDQVPEVDRTAIDGEAANWLAEVFRESVRSGIWGWYDDELAFVHGWAFAVSDIATPTAVWQGALDRNTPLAHGEWLASHIPAAHPHMLPNHGHFSLGVDSFGLMLDGLLAIAPA